MQPDVNRPVLRHIINLWTPVWYPSREQEWPLERKLAAVKEASFDGLTDRLTPEHARVADHPHSVEYMRTPKSKFQSVQ